MSKVDPETDRFELVVVGSGGVGKSSLTIRFLKDEFSDDYDPTVEESYSKSLVVDNEHCELSIVDTAGQHEYTALRDQHLSTGDGFILVFAVNDPDSVEEIKALRSRILDVRGERRVPFVLTGNKCDLPERTVDMAEMDKTATEWKCTMLETSAKENINVTESFQDLVRQCRRYRKAKQTKAGAGGSRPSTAKKGKEGGKGCCSIS